MFLTIITILIIMTPSFIACALIHWHSKTPMKSSMHELTTYMDEQYEPETQGVRNVC